MACSNIGSDQDDAKLAELGEADLLHHQVTGEAVGRLNDDGPNAVACDLGQSRGEAGSCVDRVYKRKLRLI
jgi:hypothetical protein